MNSVEKLKAEKDGLEVLHDLDRFAALDWTALPDPDVQRLKWVGLFLRDQTPGLFMQRLRITHGCLTSNQARAIADCASRVGGVIDLTTRQQIQLRNLELKDVPWLFRRQHAVGLHSMQTGMDNVRNITGCPVSGLDENELLDTRTLARELTDQIVGNRRYTNLPRKFNLSITGCRENCAHAESNDLGLVPAYAPGSNGTCLGFNVFAGGALGGAQPRLATPLDLFVRPEEAVEIALLVLDIYRDHGPRESRHKTRLKVLLEAWGEERFREELERRAGRPLERAGHQEFMGDGVNDHLGVRPQKQPGLHYVGLCVPVGRMDARQLTEAARLAEVHGSGQLRLTVGQNILIVNVPERKLNALLAEQLLQELRPAPSPLMRGLVACVGNDYCSFSTIDTKGLALELVRDLERHLPTGPAPRIHISGCPRACGKHHVADIGLLGFQQREKGRAVPAAEIFTGGSLGAQPQIAQSTGQRIAWPELAEFAARTWRETLNRKSPTASAD